ncbi:hypothetical protein [Photobacterium damselae]|uniref:hypothetical protein n=1 Tax=Photobacterium damselae TaxID=38293 RepID=UPI001F3F87BB|nr:hypothetical protein [Photobacterium damselae]UKA04845.1 hypothetical protein IHC89_21620 [Photobacterium damselae subsp. damselae]
MNFTTKEIAALECAMKMMNESSDDADKHKESLCGLLQKAKAYRRSKKIMITVTASQLEAIYSQFNDCSTMVGCGDNDADWERNIKAVNRMLKANGLPLVG